MKSLPHSYWQFLETPTPHRRPSHNGRTMSGDVSRLTERLRRQAFMSDQRLAILP